MANWHKSCQMREGANFSFVCLQSFHPMCDSCALCTHFHNFFKVVFELNLLKTKWNVLQYEPGLSRCQANVSHHILVSLHNWLYQIHQIHPTPPQTTALWGESIAKKKSWIYGHFPKPPPPLTENVHRHSSQSPWMMSQCHTHIIIYIRMLHSSALLWTLLCWNLKREANTAPEVVKFGE